MTRSPPTENLHWGYIASVIGFRGLHSSLHAGATIADRTTRLTAPEKVPGRIERKI